MSELSLEKPTDTVDEIGSTEHAGTESSIASVPSDADGTGEKQEDKPTKPKIRHGVAPLKTEYLVADYKPEVDSRYLSEAVKRSLDRDFTQRKDDAGEPPEKRIKLKGRNKKRPGQERRDDSEKICTSVLHDRECWYGKKCRFSHDMAKFLSERQKDLGPKCHNFETFGNCRHGVACRFGSQHISEDGKNIVNNELYEKTSKIVRIHNLLDKRIQKSLWKKRYNFRKAEEAVRKVQNLSPHGDPKTGTFTPQDLADDDLSPPPIDSEGDEEMKVEPDSEGDKAKKIEPDSEGDKAKKIEPDSEGDKAKKIESDSEGDKAKKIESDSEGDKAEVDNVLIDDIDSKVGKSGIIDPSSEDDKPMKVDSASETGYKVVIVGPDAEGNKTMMIYPSDEHGTSEVLESDELKSVDRKSSVMDDGVKSKPDTDQVANGSPHNISAPVENESDSLVQGPQAESSSRVRTPIAIRRITDEEGIRLRQSEKKKVDFTDKLYLAPLTTAGNLPFRRVCKRLGADITCGEMAVATNILKGQQSEWSLLKRDPSEDIFGVQICGARTDIMAKCAQLINDHTTVDFVDINCGCPIDLVFNKGHGCALMGKVTRMEQVVKSMTSVLDVPLTVKMRTGIFGSKNIAHTLIPKLRDWGVSMVTLHGRSREQRYTRLADWDYIDMCADIGKPMPVFGNGDILSFEDYNLHREQSSVSGIMLARGALMKPWLFTEIKEQRHWDISATERFDILKQYANYGMEHWGSDNVGLQTTRRFMLEWLSFLYRYIPVGLLERVPQKINERPPKYVGRSDLETLMASANCGDWIKLSEMLLGPVPDGFTFLPKHKANAYK